MSYFHTFVEIAHIADIHVDLTIDSAQNVTSMVTVNGDPVTNLPVVTGDFMSAIICVNARSGGSPVFTFVVNVTRGQTVNLSTTVHLPALSIDAASRWTSCRTTRL